MSKQTVREARKMKAETVRAWSRPSLEDTAEHVSKKLGIQIGRGGVYEAERRAVEKIRRELLKWMHGRSA